MDKNNENEKRLMLTKEQYDLLMSDFSKEESSILLNQINYYFDDEDLSLRNHHIVLRIRNIDNDKYELTAKIKGKNNEGDLELNYPLNESEVNELIANPHFNYQELKEIIERTTTKPIKYITSLKTIRLECQKEDHLVVIDKNFYSDVIDYNLEVEASSIEAATKYILYYQDKYHLTYDDNYLSKSRRAINKALNKNN